MGARRSDMLPSKPLWAAIGSNVKSRRGGRRRWIDSLRDLTGAQGGLTRIHTVCCGTARMNGRYVTIFCHRKSRSSSRRHVRCSGHRGHRIPEGTRPGGVAGHPPGTSRDQETPVQHLYGLPLRGETRLDRQIVAPASGHQPGADDSIAGLPGQVSSGSCGAGVHRHGLSGGSRS